MADTDTDICATCLHTRVWHKPENDGHCMFPWLELTTPLPPGAPPACPCAVFGDTAEAATKPADAPDAPDVKISDAPDAKISDAPPDAPAPANAPPDVHTDAHHEAHHAKRKRW